jgi:hypothetical protein
MIVVSTILISLGMFFLTVSALGLVRLPDLYTRAHAVAKSETLGLMLVFVGLFFRPELDVARGIAPPASCHHGDHHAGDAAAVLIGSIAGRRAWHTEVNPC